MVRRRWLVRTELLLVAVFFFTGSRGDLHAAPFYEGKTLTVIEGRNPGGLGDLRVRATLGFVQKYLAGNPTIVVRYMPGAGGMIAANHMAKVAKRDGLTIANIGSNMYARAILRERGVRYKLEDFVYFGAPSPGTSYALVVRPQLGLDTVEKLKAYEGLRFGQRSVGHGTYITDRLIAYILELKKPRWIFGYNSSELIVAIERGEADARTTAITAIPLRTPHWLKEGYSFPLVIKNRKGRGAELVPEFPQDTPTLEQFADTRLKQALMRYNNALSPSSAPFLAPKGIPTEALTALKKAFNKVWSDPQFPAAYSRMALGDPGDPMTGEQIERVLQERPTDPKIDELYRQLLGAGPLPPAK